MTDVERHPLRASRKVENRSTMPKSSIVQTTPVMPRKAPAVKLSNVALEAELAEAKDLCEQLLHGPRDADTKKHGGLGAPTLIEMLRTSSGPDGWGNHSPGTDAPERPPRRVLDDDGEIIQPDPDAASDGLVSDPTMNAALAAAEGRAADGDRRLVVELVQEVHAAVRALRSATNRLYQAQPDDAKHGAGEPRCRSCARAGTFEHVYDKAQASALCRWCYDWWLAHDGALPPVKLLKERIKGTRITTAVLKKLGIPA